MVTNSGLALQTHSAYMLFYKRVELEEDNGKDFSFDVSPDLLEVPVLPVFSLTLVPALTSCFSRSGFGTTTCSFCRTRTYLNTPTSGTYQVLGWFGAW